MPADAPGRTAAATPPWRRAPALSLLTALVALPLAALATGVWAAQLDRRTDHEIQDALHTMSSSDVAHFQLYSVLSSFRGFVATGDETYLRTWEESIPALQHALEDLAGMSERQPDQAARWRRVGDFVRTWESEVAQPLIANVRQRGPGNRQVGPLLDEGDRRFTAMSGLFGDAHAAEIGRLDALLREQSTANRSTIAALLVGLFGVSALGGTFTWLLVHAHRGRERAEAAARATAEEALQARAAFTASLTHDLRSPLTVVHGMADLLLEQSALERGPGADRRREALGAIVAASWRVDSMLGELSDLGRLQQGQPLALDHRPADLVTLAHGVVAGLEPDAAARVRIHAPAPVAGEWDTRRVQRALANLVSNALKYSEGSVDVHVRPDGESALVSVRDRGIGIPAAESARVLEPYYRASNAAALPGMGLGLASVAQVAEAHGGRLAVDSTEGVGTTVCLRLPRSPSASPPSRSADPLTRS